jgi:hypothetical protein
MSARGTRGGRVSQADLVRESRAILEKAGVGPHCRALYLSGIANEVIASENPAFRQFRPHVLIRKSIAWNRAYAVVFQYFAEHNLQLTKRIARREGRESLPAPKPSTSTADEQLSDLVDGAPEKQSVQQKLNAEQERVKPSSKTQKTAGNEWGRRTVTPGSGAKGVIVISSPAARKRTIASDSEGNSDVVVEEIPARRFGK